MVQHGPEVIVPATTYLAVDLAAVLISVGQYKETLLVKKCLVDLLNCIVGNFLFLANDKLIFVGDDLFVSDYCEISAQEHDCREKNRRRLLVENKRVIRFAFTVNVLFFETCTEIAIISKPQSKDHEQTDVELQISPSIFAATCFDWHWDSFRILR